MESARLLVEEKEESQGALLHKYFWACSLSEGDSLNKIIVFSQLPTNIGRLSTLHFLHVLHHSSRWHSCRWQHAHGQSPVPVNATSQLRHTLCCGPACLPYFSWNNQIGSIHNKKSLMMMVDRLQLVPRVWWQANQQLLPECQ